MKAIKRARDRALVAAAVHVHSWAEQTIARIRGQRGRDFIGDVADRIDCRRAAHEITRRRIWGDRPS